jgi:ribosomal protein S18 acetylase RimI-like enzyme
LGDPRFLPKPTTDKKQTDQKFAIREIKSGEVREAAELVTRLKKLNGEFDPLLKNSAEVNEEALRTLQDAVSGNKSVVLVATSRSKVVGVVRADLRDRFFYEPRKEGAIIEFYILPEFRRGDLGRELFETVVSMLQKRGAELITAEFPSQNEIARKFYTKLGFRSLIEVFAKSS